MPGQGYGPPPRAYGPPPGRPAGGYGPPPGPGYGQPVYGPGPGATTGGFPTGPQPAPRSGPQPTPAGVQQTAQQPTVAASGEPKGDLTVGKVIAGAGAAATSAVLGSFFGAMGTVTGAAAGAVFSSVVTEVMERSFNRTRDTVKAVIKLPGGRSVDVAGKTEVPAPPVAAGGETGQARVYVTPGDRPTEVMAAVPGADRDRKAQPATRRRSPRRRLLVMTGFAALVFALGMLAITGVELVKGSPINTSRSTSTEPKGSTSLGSVLGGSKSASTETSKSKATESATETAEPTAEKTRSKSTEAPESTAEPQPESPAPTATRAPRVTPAPTANPGGGDAGGAVPNAQGGPPAPTLAPQ